MLILLDLDGTLTNTVHPSWKPYKDGLKNCPINKIPLFDGVEDFLKSRKNKGDSLVIVSDSHPSYVNPIADYLGLEALSLADKPNVKRLKSFLNSHPKYKKFVSEGQCVFIGDTKLDIEIGRMICALTIWFLPYNISDEIKDKRDGIGDDMASKKMGPTYTAKTFSEMDKILDSPLKHLYSIESSFVDSSSVNSIHYYYKKYKDGSYACIRCLGRQEQGLCDKFACADKYFMVSNPNRSNGFLNHLVDGISSYLNQTNLLEQRWDYFTYITDKKTTIPHNKMEEIFNLVDVPIQKERLFSWKENTQGSLRNHYFYNERRDFLEQYLIVDCPKGVVFDLFCKKSDITLSLFNKNIIVLDDQLTTGATAWFVIKKLKQFGARNILFIAMFQMILAVNDNEIICPHCGRPMDLKIRRSDGMRFYSCTPPKYKGNGCGFILSKEIHDKYQNILQMYPKSVDIFLKGKENIINKEKLVVNSMNIIKLIDKHELYICKKAIDNNEISRVLELDKKGNELIYSNIDRNRYYRDFAYKYSDDSDNELSCLAYSLEHIKELDSYISKVKS